MSEKFHVKQRKVVVARLGGAKRSTLQALALKLLNMEDADFYNWFMGGTNPTGKKRLKELREILALASGTGSRRKRSPMIL